MRSGGQRSAISALVLVLVLVVTGCCHRAGLAGTEGT
jgi:hypothetical protein